MRFAFLLFCLPVVSGQGSGDGKVHPPPSFGVHHRIHSSIGNSLFPALSFFRCLLKLTHSTSLRLRLSLDLEEVENLLQPGQSCTEDSVCNSGTCAACPDVVVTGFTNPADNNSPLGCPELYLRKGCDEPQYRDVVRQKCPFSCKTGNKCCAVEGGGLLADGGICTEVQECSSGVCGLCEDTTYTQFVDASTGQPLTCQVLAGQGGCDHPQHGPLTKETCPFSCETGRKCCGSTGTNTGEPLSPPRARHVSPTTHVLLPFSLAMRNHHHTHFVRNDGESGQR
jgi:hypothetical protein